MGKLSSEKGSSTILITLLLVILFVFAVLSVTTTASEVKLARRNVQTNLIYYTLDAEGKRFLFDIKSDIKDALERAENKPDQFFRALDGLLEQSVIRETDRENLSMTIERKVVLKEDSRHRYLDIKLLVSQPWPASNPNDILTILEWKLSQEPFEYKNTLDLWEGMP